MGSEPSYSLDATKKHHKSSMCIITSEYYILSAFDFNSHTLNLSVTLYHTNDESPQQFFPLTYFHIQKQKCSFLEPPQFFDKRQHKKSQNNRPELPKNI